MNNVDEYYNNHELRFIIHNKGYGKENYELRKRIDKAIDYISEYRNGWNNWFEFTIDDKLKLLDILKGSDTNVKD